MCVQSPIIIWGVEQGGSHKTDRWMDNVCLARWTCLITLIHMLVIWTERKKNTQTKKSEHNICGCSPITRTANAQTIHTLPYLLVSSTIPNLKQTGSLLSRHRLLIKVYSIKSPVQSSQPWIFIMWNKFCINKQAVAAHYMSWELTVIIFQKVSAQVFLPLFLPSQLYFMGSPLLVRFLRMWNHSGKLIRPTSFWMLSVKYPSFPLTTKISLINGNRMFNLNYFNTMLNIFYPHEFKTEKMKPTISPLCWPCDPQTRSRSLKVVKVNGTYKCGRYVEIWWENFACNIQCQSFWHAR